LDTQQELHPLLSVDDGDLESAKKLAIQLRDDDDFYSERSLFCRENYVASLYNEKNFTPYITKILEGLNNG
jgi:hypothetical protein